MLQEFNHLVLVLTSHSRITYVNSSSNIYKSRILEFYRTNLEFYVDGKPKAGERSVLSTKWVGDAWKRVKKQKILLNIQLKMLYI